ncbi:MAG TPA: GNAT family N-acetyltransferase [Bryobacteraceae bacterium]|nr:GNAT family N-acetyltransferase [Bryobacteraceae bacterium]
MHWIRFNDWCALHSIRGHVRDSHGVHAAWSHTRLIINNLTAPIGPVASVADLRGRARAAIADAAPHKLPWMFGIPEPWLPVSLDEANAVLSTTGLRYKMYMTVMECAGPLAGPLRPLPQDVEIRRVDSAELRSVAINLNCQAYDIPGEIAAEALGANLYFSDPEKEFGFVVYDREGIPVSTATAIDLGGWMYIAAVATAEEHRRQGYAEVAVRAALAAAPEKPTSLDATRTGEPLYAQMGYRRQFRWNFWEME